ncbi:MAG: IclR family transcriptional regulator [Burkholderia sp.]|jgi:DNA-binding IclR family transcriptional regulator|nr:IclR family transcriptional regulator [Burkholderia sp.]
MRRRKVEPTPPLMLADVQAPEQVDSLQRGLEILRLFDGRHPLLSQAEIASRLDLSRATAAKLLSTLVAFGFLREDAGGSYEPHAACLALGRAVQRGLPVVQTATPLMTQFAEQFGVHVSLMTRDRSQMLVLEYCVPGGQDTLGLGAGALVPIASSASGRAYLWAQKPALQAELIDGLKQAGQEGAHRFMPGVYAAFQELEETGFCYLASPVTRHSNSIAAPLYDKGSPDYVLAAMAVGASDAERKLREEVGPQLLQVSAQISRELERLPL